MLLAAPAAMRPLLSPFERWRPSPNARQLPGLGLGLALGLGLGRLPERPRWDAAGTLLGRCWDAAGTLLGRCWDAAGTLLGHCWDAAGRLWDALGDPGNENDGFSMVLQAFLETNKTTSL